MSGLLRGKNLIDYSLHWPRNDIIRRKAALSAVAWSIWKSGSGGRRRDNIDNSLGSRAACQRHPHVHHIIVGVRGGGTHISPAAFVDLDYCLSDGLDTAALGHAEDTNRHCSTRFGNSSDLAVSPGTQRVGCRTFGQIIGLAPLAKLLSSRLIKIFALIIKS